MQIIMIKVMEMTLFKILILALIGGLIGWVTNFLAIKLLFKPFQEYPVPILNWKFQGLIPKRRKEIAKTIAETVEKELFSVNDLMEGMLKHENQERILLILKKRIIIAVKKKLPPMLSLFSPAIHNMVESIIEKEGRDILSDILKNGVVMLTEQVRVSELVEGKINSFDLERLEKIVLDIAKKELRHIEILGGVLGFFIGLIQGILILIIL